MVDVAHCQWCGEEDETAAHAIFHCVRVKELWEESECVAAVLQEGESMCDVLVRWGEVGRKVKQRASILAWVIWMERNDKIFSDKTTPNDVLLARVYKAVEEHGLYSKKVYAVSAAKQQASSNKWNPPPVGVVKLNSDASLSEEGWVGMGVIARDSEGNVLFAATRRVKAWWPPGIAEGKAMLLAVKLAKRFGYDNVILESDNQVLITRLTKASVYLSDFDVVLEDILSTSSAFMSFLWSHVKRDGNIVAHHLAKLMPFGVEQVWVNHCPVMISPYVLSDKLSID
ncbi:uncharacterized protein LOC110720310 [Chenopodium quinoa]|uniref:uncharacterized protein LOC110720310 n=1 Tax=Chenopodium quinoa TaxID=63459 RepID=UPI000B7850E9|nr:uncharacterized protein LOC110720310 [Chenopodium quinoa]